MKKALAKYRRGLFSLFLFGYLVHPQGGPVFGGGHAHGPFEIAPKDGLRGEIQVKGNLLNRIHGGGQLRLGIQNHIVLDP